MADGGADGGSGSSLTAFFSALGETLAACSGVGEAAARGLESIAAWFEAESGYLLLRQRGSLCVRAVCGKAKAALKGTTLPAEQAGALAEGGEPLLFPAAGGAGLPAGLARLVGKAPASLMAAPLRDRKRVFGLILLTGGKARPFGAGELEILTAAALYTAQVIEKLCYLRIGKRMASIDSLTGVRGRRSLEKTLAAEIDRCKRYKTPLSVLWIELDDFKRITDTFGHAAADKALIEAARILSGNIRNVDTLARYGGDEFVILLPNTSKENAQIVRQRILTDLEQYNSAKQELPFQMSLGLHTAGPEGVEDILTYSDLDLKRRRYHSEELDLENLENHLGEMEMEEPD
jgi:diguanylate cyclase (GGDEF)-like protein